MEYIKCKKCGSLVLKNSAITYSCMICDKEYSTQEINGYIPEADYDSTISNIVEEAFENNNDIVAAKAINTFLDSLSEDLLPDGIYQVEYNLLILAQNKIHSYGDEFAEWSWDYNYGQRFINDCSYVTDFIYSVCSQSNNRISYEYIMNYASFVAKNIVIKGWKCEVNSRWKKYTQDKEALQELIEVGSVGIKALKQFIKYGDVCFDCVYNTIIFLHEELCSASYPNYYWIGDYRATENIGLTVEAKAIRRKEIEEMKGKEAAAIEKKTAIKNKIIAEEQRIEAEKKAKRIEKFWSNNQQLKLELEEEKKTCEAKIIELTTERDSINANDKIQEIHEEIKLIHSTLAVLGFFAFKQKKEKRMILIRLENEIEDLKNEVKKKKAEVQTKIDILRNRITQIDDEFTKDRQE